MNVSLTAREIELVIQALAERRNALEGYLRWIDDRPMLPAREKAIETVKAEVLESLKLSHRLFELKVTS